MHRERLLRWALNLSLFSIFMSGVMGGLAVVVGLQTNALSLLGFGFDAAVDSIASVALSWRFYTEARDPSRAERVELIAEQVVGGVLLLLAGYLAITAIGALASGRHPDATLLGTAVALVSTFVLPGLAVAKYGVARGLGSRALRGDAVLTGVAAVLAIVTLVSLVLTAQLGIAWADAGAALLVAAVLVREGWTSARAGRRGKDLLA
jgi:divalent metal cation (Fe/Co/Zn/Cd) transporter